MTNIVQQTSQGSEDTMKSYAIWNNKGGVGKTYLSFAMATEFARQNPDKRVIFADMCPQANLSEILLGGNGTGAARLADLIRQRKTIGGYFDRRTRSPHMLTGAETSFLIPVSETNQHVPANVFLIAGDPSLEVQAQVINQLSSVNLPVDSWKNIHLWLRDLLVACAQQQGIEDTVCFIDCNPSFSAYTELSLIAANAIIVPCSSDGSSARAVDNLSQLVYGVGVQNDYRSVNFYDRCVQFGLSVPVIHSLVFNRSTEYDKRASKAFSAMFDEILSRAENLRRIKPNAFQGGDLKTFTVPDNHSVAIVSSHLGRPLFDITPGRYQIHDTEPQINNEPLERYGKAIETLVSSI